MATPLTKLYIAWPVSSAQKRSALAAQVERLEAALVEARARFEESRLEADRLALTYRAIVVSDDGDASEVGNDCELVLGYARGKPCRAQLQVRRSPALRG